MSDKEMNAYRFGIGQEPTDEMLEQIMKEVPKRFVKVAQRQLIFIFSKCFKILQSNVSLVLNA